MSKSIFKYDSSDEEDSVSKHRVDHALDKEDLYSYKLGNAILHHKSVVDKYKQAKKVFGYQKSNHSKIVTKYLTQKEYSEEDFNVKTLSDLLTTEKKNISPYDLVRSINSTKLSYDKIKDIIKKEGYKQEKGLIDIEKLYCFEILDKYVNGQADNKDLSKAFGIKEEIVNDFCGKLWEIQNIQKIVSNLTSYISNNPIIKDVTQKHIIGELNIEALPVALTLSIQFEDRIRLINSTKLLYNQIKDIIQKGKYKQEKGLIDVEKLYCFEVLDKYVNGQVDNKALSKAFGIKEEIVNDFCGKLWEIQNIQHTVRQLCLLKEEGRSLLTQKIYQHITSTREQNINKFNFVITLACNKKLHNELDHNFVQYNTDIHQETEKLKFFDEKILSFDAPSNFLSKSILYQKHLKTAIKFRELQQFPNQLNGGYIIATDKDQIKLENTFTSGLKRTEKVSSLGTYNQIANILTEVKEILEYTSDAQLIDAFKALLTGKKLDYNYNQNEAIKVLKDTVYLLFSCEPNRNPSALITNVIFLELVKMGKYKITDMAEIMPMAMKGAIDVGRYYHYKYEDISNNKAKKNDYGKSSFNKFSSETKEFQKREVQLLKDWIIETVGDEPITLDYVLTNNPDYLDDLIKFLDSTKDTFFLNHKGKNLLDSQIFKELFNSISTQVDGTREEFENILNQIIFSTKIKSYELCSLLKSWYNLDIGYWACLTDLQRSSIEGAIKLFLKTDKYSLLNFTNNENEQEQFLECLNYWYIKPIVKIFINEGSTTKLIAHNVFSAVYEALQHERYYPFNIIYYTNPYNEFKQIKSVFYDNTSSFSEIKKIFFTIEDIMEYVDNNYHNQFHNFDYDNHQLDLLGHHNAV